jgi:tRNA-uridine 2-sulfurtransferase
VRSTRPPQPAMLIRGAEGYEVALAGGEEGVAPGQACVLYDSGEGQARMLGGGFIRAAVAHTAVGARPQARAQNLPAAATRG